MAEHTVHIRLDSTYYDTLQRMRSRERFPPSINAIATALLKSGIDAASTPPLADRRRCACGALETGACTGTCQNGHTLAPLPAHKRKAPTTADIERRVDALRDPERPTLVIGDEIVIAGAAAPETPTQRLDRLRAAAGLSQRALCEQLGISYGKLQRARADGKVPAEVEAWMQQREGGGR